MKPSYNNTNTHTAAQAHFMWVVVFSHWSHSVEILKRPRNRLQHFRLMTEVLNGVTEALEPRPVWTKLCSLLVYSATLYSSFLVPKVSKCLFKVTKYRPTHMRQYYQVPFRWMMFNWFHIEKVIFKASAGI